MTEGYPLVSVEEAVTAFFGATRRARGRANQRGGAGGLTLAQFNLVEPLLEGPQGAGKLAGEAAIQPSTATRVIDGLVARGVVQRRPADTDRRRVLVELTPEGRVATEAKREEVMERRRRIAAAFAEEERPQVVDLLLRLAAAVEEL